MFAHALNSPNVYDCRLDLRSIIQLIKGIQLVRFTSRCLINGAMFKVCMVCQTVVVSMEEDMVANSELDIDQDNIAWQIQLILGDLLHLEIQNGRSRLGGRRTVIAGGMIAGDRTSPRILLGQEGMISLNQCKIYLLILKSSHLGPVVE